MTDRELLEAAAKAAGIWDACDPWCGMLKSNGQYWNPLEDDGDALRLAVKLFFTTETCWAYAQVITPNGGVYRVFAEEVKDPYAATRRAIVLAAAEIGMQM